jgi:hypothetical protein
VVYESALENVQQLEGWNGVRVAWSEKDERYIFCNGELTDEPGETVLERLKEGLMACPDRLAAEQKVFRIKVMRNDLGFHSRDIFQDQKVFSGVTRLMLRSMSEEAVPVPMSRH